MMSPKAGSAPSSGVATEASSGAGEVRWEGRGQVLGSLLDLECGRVCLEAYWIWSVAECAWKRTDRVQMPKENPDKITERAGLVAKHGLQAL